MGYENEHTLQVLLKKVYRRLDMDETVTEMEVKQAYTRVVGDFINRLTWNIRFVKGVLTVELASAALRQEIFNRRTSLAEKINESLGRNAVKKIIFV